MTTAVAAILLLMLLALAVALIDRGPRPLPRRITTDDRRRRAPDGDFEIAVTDHRGDLDDGTATSVGGWLAAGGLLLAAIVAAVVGADG